MHPSPYSLWHPLISMFNLHNAYQHRRNWWLSTNAQKTFLTRLLLTLSTDQLTFWTVNAIKMVCLCTGFDDNITSTHLPTIYVDCWGMIIDNEDGLLSSLVQHCFNLWEEFKNVTVLIIFISSCKHSDICSIPLNLKVHFNTVIFEIMESNNVKKY